jgi:hypothetical protein
VTQEFSALCFSSNQANQNKSGKITQKEAKLLPKMAHQTEAF